VMAMRLTKESFMRKPTDRDGESGVALLSAILILALMSALLIGFVAMVNSDQAASGINRDQTQAYAAAHAGVEKLTADLGQLFLNNFAPTGADVNLLEATTRVPTLPGIDYLRPNGQSGYQIDFDDVAPMDGNPDTPTNGTRINAGPYEGLTGLITPYRIEVAARTTAGGAEVRMRRELQTVAIPVFQFGIFSENDLSFFAGPNFAFGGRVHTNQHLFLKQDSGNTLTLQDRVTAVGEIIRTHLANGESGSHTSTVRMALAAGCPAAPAPANGACRNLGTTTCGTTAACEGSLENTIGSPINDDWADLSIGTYNGWIRNGRTGARRLDLPVVSDGARPVDLIRRPPVGEDDDSNLGRQRFYNMATLRILLSDRPTDLTTAVDVVTTAGVSPMPLTGGVTITSTERTANANILPAGTHPFAASDAAATFATLRDSGFRTTPGTGSIGGYIVINRQDRDGNWTDVTKEIMNYGFAGKRLSAAAVGPSTTNGLFTNNPANDCVAPHPNAIIRVQRYREADPMAPFAPANQPPCAIAAASLNQRDYWPNVLYDPREGMLRDNENARPTAPATLAGANVTAGDPRLYWSGVMHYVELDVHNLRRYLRGELGGVNNAAACINGGGGGTCPMDVTGFVVYFSDRRGNRDFTGSGAAAANPVVNTVPAPPGNVGGYEVVYGQNAETGELGFEDIINTTGAPNGTLDHFYTDVDGNNRSSEDLNWELPSVLAANAPGRGTLQTYGAAPRLLPWAPTRNALTSSAVNQMLWIDQANYTPTSAAAPTAALYSFWNTPVDRLVARVNRAFFFRRGLKLVNGGRGELPANGSQGLTVAAENPVYIEGNYNACNNNIVPMVPLVANSGRSTANSGNNFQFGCNGAGFGGTPGADHVSAAVIADAVTLLSNAWNDIRSFNDPHNSDTDAAAPFSAAGARKATTTWYRTAVISGKGLNFPRALALAAAGDGADWGTDGGAHNFLRYIENWGGTPQMTLNYRGSIISFYTNRQAVGTYKCCDIVYNPPARGFNFDTDFLTPQLLPPRTPMFRDLNTLTFRQVLRPTQ